MNIIKKLMLVTACLLIISCATKPQFHIPQAYPTDPQKLVVFIDGTANDENSYTNVSKLRNIVTWQNKPNIKTVYIAGVGTGYRIAGKGLGTGFSNDVRQAYEFLTVNHQHVDDKVYLLGFSRGAYAVRALAGLVQVAGIPNLSGLTSSQRQRVVKSVFKTYKSKGTVKERREKLAAMNIEHYAMPTKQKLIEFVGIWDTVSAMGKPDYEEKNILDDPTYIDQLCNAKHVAHALSLDDDRARVFTPMLLTNHAAKQQCDISTDDEKMFEILGEKIKLGGRDARYIEQVFFSGAHSDVGGGYEDTHISGVSLNWMLSKIKPFGLVPESAKVYADPYGKTHDPEAELNAIYAFKHRSISRYQALLDKPLTVHQSVIKRLEFVHQQCNEIQWLAQDNLFRHCFKKSDGGLSYTADNEKCTLRVVKDESYQYKKPESNKFPVCSADEEGVFPCKITVDPRSRNGNPQVQLSKHHSYLFSIKTIDWSDHGLCATPENGRRISRSDSSYLMKGLQYLGKAIAFAPSAGYMELIGEVDGEIIRIGQLTRDGDIFSPRKNGSLVIRVNEPVIGKTFYDNNEGSATLYITRVH